MLRSLSIALCLLALAVQSLDLKSIKQCLKDYRDAVVGKHSPLPTLWQSSISSYAGGFQSLASSNKGSGRLIFDVGLGSLVSSQVFNHMIQLNISGLDSKARSSWNCTYDTKQKDRTFKDQLLASRDLLYLVPHNKPTLLHAVASDAKVLMNDLTDEQWMENANKSMCKSGASPLPEACYLPVLELTGFERSRVSKAHLKRMELEQVGPAAAAPILAAYRRLIGCVVPPERLFTFNLRQVNPSDYWRDLSSFLGVSLSSPQLEHLAEGGVMAPVQSITLCREGACRAKVEQVVPSACDDPRQYAAIAATEAASLRGRFDKCTAAYADEIGDIFGAKFRPLVLREMLSSGNIVRRAPADTRRIILGVGPGTSGTRTLFLAAKQLNITSRHYIMYGQNCSNTLFTPERDFIDSDLRALEVLPGEEPVLWTDTPVPERWWHLLKMYPRTRIIMTDVHNETQWLRKRHDEHCQAMTAANWDCTVPIAARVQHLMSKESLVREFFEAVHVTRASPQSNRRAWDAYRGLIRCAVPPEQFLSINFQEKLESEPFWSSLIGFTEVPVRPEVRMALVDAGVPRLSTHAGCMVGSHKCTFVSRSNDSAVIPSVCEVGI